MSQEQNEIDLLFVAKKTKEAFFGFVSLAFKALDYVLKYWYIIVFLLLLGFGLAWLKADEFPASRSSSVIVKVNYDLQNYVTNAFDDFNHKLVDRDAYFLQKVGYDTISPGIYALEYKPIVDFKDILNNYEVNERGLEILLKNVDFDDDDITTKDYFNHKYTQYLVKFTMHKESKKEDIDKFFDFINSNPRLQAYKEQAISDMKDMVVENKKSLSMINKVLENYGEINGTEEASSALSLSLYPPALERIVETKMALQRENSRLQMSMAISTDIVSPLSRPNIVKEKPSILSRKKITYPIGFVFLFLFLSYLRYLYIYFRKKVS